MAQTDQGRSSTGKKGSRKHGRNKRKPAQKRYTAEQRWIANKARKKARHQRHLEKCRERRSHERA